MNKRKDFETRFKVSGDRPKGKSKALRFPGEIDDELEQMEDWKSFVVEAVRKQLPSEGDWGRGEGDNQIALELFSRLCILMPNAAPVLPGQGYLKFESNRLSIEMLVSDRPLFRVFGEQSFQLQMTDDDWKIDCKGELSLSEVQAARDFCENVMHIWEQVMVSLEFADRIED